MPDLPNSSVGEMSYKVSALKRPFPCDGEAAVLEALLPDTCEKQQSQPPSSQTHRDYWEREGIARQEGFRAASQRAGFNSA